MRSSDSFYELIRMPLSSKEVRDFLTELGIVDVPKIKRGDTGAHVSNESIGVELYFEDERLFAGSNSGYKDGDLVLVSIDMYVAPKGDFSAFPYPLPKGLSASISLNETKQLFGTPAFFNQRLGTVRWDYDAYSLGLTFKDDGKSLRDASVLYWRQ